MEKTESTFINTSLSEEKIVCTSLPEDKMLCANIISTPLRLTPTGKISHAKTRVYTQRYRKEWEQMPDFKGWLTSVAFQPTRAFCIYCKKDLHAHRLSLLKHTCTMKHQRAALAHKAEEGQKPKPDTNNCDIELIEEVETADDHRTEDDEDNEEYIIERLDTDDEGSTDTSEVKRDTVKIIVQEDDEKEENDLRSQLELSDDDDSKPVIKKIKLSDERCRDPLAEAMAHVHNEYLEEDTEDQDNVEIEMVVEEPTDGNVMFILPNSTDDIKEAEEEPHESEKTARLSESVDKKSAEKVLNSVHMMPLPVTSPQNKTITLTSGKTLSLTGGCFQPGTQYVLSKLPRKLPTLMVADKKPIVAVNQTDPSKIVQLTKTSPTPVSPSTSQQSYKKSTKSTILKKLRISTHVVDTTKGVPIGGLQVSLYKLMDGRWTFINESNTNPNGRCIDLLDKTELKSTSGRYKIHFDVDKYFTLRRIETMFPFIEIAFDVKNPHSHYHIPIMLSPFGFSAYRGP